MHKYRPILHGAGDPDEALQRGENQHVWYGQLRDPADDERGHNVDVVEGEETLEIKGFDSV